MKVSVLNQNKEVICTIPNVRNVEVAGDFYLLSLYDDEECKVDVKLSLLVKSEEFFGRFEL